MYKYKYDDIKFYTTKAVIDEEDPTSGDNSTKIHISDLADFFNPVVDLTIGNVPTPPTPDPDPEP